MYNRWIAIVFVTAIAIWDFSGCKPVVTPLKPTAEQSKQAERWLVTDCSVGDSNKLDAKLKEAGNVLEDSFVKAYRHGPDSALLNEYLAGARSEFARVRKSLQTSDSLLLAPGDASLVLQQDSASFIKETRADFILGYRSNALLGLGIVGGDSAKAILQKLATDTSSALYPSAVAALNRLIKPGVDSY